MRLIFWVTALAVLSIASAKNSTAKTKPKRQLENIRTPQNLQYSLVLPHSRVAHFRSLTSSRRISNGAPKGKLPPYAVQMEPVVQYSQKDPLYDPNLENIDDQVVNKNEIYAQPKILNVHDQEPENSFGPPYGGLPTAPLYSEESHPHQHSHPHYYEAPEPIIEIIIKESNESLPAPPPTPILKKKKEPVQVFYVKYSKDPHAHDKVVYEKPIPAITPPSNDEDDHEQYVTVTPEPLYIPPQTTTLRAIIKPDSQIYHSDSSVKVTFGNNEHHHYSDRREGSSNNEDREETAPRPAIAFPQQSPSHPPLGRSASSKPTQYYDSITRPAPSHPQNYRPVPQQAQNRIQFQSPYLSNEPQLPRQGPTLTPFRPHARQNPFGPSPSPNPSPAFPNASPGPIGHFNNVAPTIAGPISPSFAPNFPRPQPSFQPRPSNQPPFASRPHFNGPPRSNFHPGPQRPAPHPQPQPFFDEAKYLQENYHTITTENLEPSKDQGHQNRPSNSFNLVNPSPSPSLSQTQETHSRPQLIPYNQQLPQQRPPQYFNDNHKPSFNSDFRFKLKPSPPHVSDNRPPFQSQFQPQEQFSFHQGPQFLPKPSTQLPLQHNAHNQHSFPGPSAIPPTQFLPQPSSPPQFDFQPQPSPPPQQSHFHHSPSERPAFQQSHGPSDRPPHNNFQDQSNLHHQQNVGQFVPKGGELVAAIPKYEQHITVNGDQPNYNLLGDHSPSPSTPSPDSRYRHPQQNSHQQQYQQQLQQQQIQQQRLEEQKIQHQREQQQIHQHKIQEQKIQQQQIEQQQIQHQQYQQQQEQQQPQQQYYDPEQEQVRQQLAQNVHKQQEEIKRLQAQLLIAQQQQQQSNNYEENYTQTRNNYNQQQYQATSPKPQYHQERSRPQNNYVTSSTPTPYYQSTSRTVEIKPTTQKYVSSTVNSISSTEAKKEEKKKKPAFELPDEVPDDLRQQLLSSGILDNADISILDYDKVGDTPLDSLPPDQLANFFSAGGGQQIAASENRPIIVSPNGDNIESRIDESDDDDDQEIAASENVPSYVAPPTEKQAVEMKVVHFDPKTKEGQSLAKEYVKDDATQVDPVALNDKKYNRYLPLKVSGNQFPLPDILKGRKVTSVVVLAPVETAALNGDHSRSERATSNNLKGIKFVAGDSLQDVLKKPTTDNFNKWLATEKKTSADLQSVVLLVTGSEEPSSEREIYMYDISSGNVNKLSGELSNAFVEAAENNSLSKDIEKLAIEGEGIPENFDKDEMLAEGSENVPLLVDLSGLSLEQENSNQVSISSGYSKTKLGRSIRRH